MLLVSASEMSPGMQRLYVDKIYLAAENREAQNKVGMEGFEFLNKEVKTRDRNFLQDKMLATKAEGLEGLREGLGSLESLKDSSKPVFIALVDIYRYNREPFDVIRNREEAEGRTMVVYDSSMENFAVRPGKRRKAQNCAIKTPKRMGYAPLMANHSLIRVCGMGIRRLFLLPLGRGLLGKTMRL